MATAAPQPRTSQESFELFVAAVQNDRLEEAWNLYAARVPGDTGQHNADLGCEFAAFSLEFRGLRHFFARAAPFEIVSQYGNAPGSNWVELGLRGADGLEYLVSLVKIEADGPFLVISLNSGKVLPFALPSPQDPQGFCALWTGGR